MRKAIAMRRLHEERGAYAVLYAILAAAIFTFVALSIGLGQVRAQKRDGQAITDLAASAAGHKIAERKPQEACLTAWSFLQANLENLAPGAAIDCSVFPVDTPAACPLPITLNATGEDPEYDIFFMWPVLDSALDDDAPIDPNYDGVPCERMMVSVQRHFRTPFGGFAGGGEFGVPAQAVVRGSQGITPEEIPALLILDFNACNVLTTSGQGSIFVGASEGFTDDGEFVTSPGFVAVDSLASKPGGGADGCGNVNRHAIEANDNALNFIRAEDDPIEGTDAIIASQGMNLAQGSCDVPNIHVCDASDVLAGRLEPQPRFGKAVTRKIVDYKFNCNSIYGLTNPVIGPCPEAALATSARNVADAGETDWIDKLRAAIGPPAQGLPPVFGTDFTWYPGNPVTWSDYRTSPLVEEEDGTAVPPGASRCSPGQATIVVPPGNWWVNCTGPSGLQVQNKVTFLSDATTPANVVFQGKVTTGSQGYLAINSPNTLPADDAGKCPNGPPAPDGTGVPAGFTYLRNNDFDKDAQSSLVMCSTLLYFANGAINFGAGDGVLKWLAPFNGPFEDLALWSETGGVHRLGGQTSLVVEGIFFTPNALPFRFTGQAGQNQAAAQFITRRLDVTGQGTLVMEPHPARALFVEVFGSYLID